MDLAKKLAEERRARLAAERLLHQKSRELSEANRQLARHARTLSHEISETRNRAEALAGRNASVQVELRQVSRAAALAEERLWASLGAIRDGFAIYDPDLRLAAGNPAYLAMFEGLEDVRPGACYYDILRLSLEEGLFDNEGLEIGTWLQNARDRLARTPIAPRVLRLWDGRYIKVVDRFAPSGDLVTLTVDMTETMRTLAALEAIPDGFVLFDQDDRMVMCNERYREIYARTANRIRPGTSFEDLLRFGLQENQYDLTGKDPGEWMAHRLACHQITGGLVEEKLADGRWVRILEKRTPDGGVAGLRVDITEQKAQQQVLEQARRAADAASRAKSVFLATMSHELRTPMNGVVGMADLLCATEMTGEQRDYAETIRQSGETLLRLLGDILDFSKLEAEKMTLHTAPFDLKDLAEEVVGLMRNAFAGRMLTLSVTCDPALPGRLMGDAGRLRQILTNLVGNAVKFTEKGRVEVGIGGHAQGGCWQVRLTVSDSGIGIAPEMREHIFGEFNQVDDRKNRRFEGTGLGLSITRRLVDLMGGRIWVESEPGTGSCFGVDLCLPVAPGAVVARRMRVLAVDDNQTNRLVFTSMAKHLDIDLELVDSGPAAIEAWERERPDMVFMDISMPGMDGKEATRRIREREAAQGAPRTPVIALTAHALPGDDAEILDAGLDGYETKPLRRARLVGLLNAHAPPGCKPATPDQPRRKTGRSAPDSSGV